MRKTGFFNQDKKVHAIILFLLVLVVDLLAAVLGFGGAQFIFLFAERINMFSSFESLIFSILAICLNFLIVIYSYINNQPNKLKALGYANLIMSFVPFVFNSIYYPFVYLVVEAITDLANISDAFHFSDFRFFLAEFISLPLSVCCFVLLFRLKKCNEDRKNNCTSFCKLSLITVVVFVLVSVFGLVLVFNLIYITIFKTNFFIKYLQQPIFLI